jgi:23S rRNA pseudouridine1911/1915/1917 synthase
MAKTDFIELRDGREVHRIPILYEDRAVLAIDKPRNWMLVPFTWQRTNRNLQAAITSSIAARDFWARCRNLRFLRNIHRLDAETSGVLLFGKSTGAVRALAEIFESRQMEKTYLAIVHGKPAQTEWTCNTPIEPDPKEHGKMKAGGGEDSKDAETHFKVLASGGGHALIEAHPLTGRTHQIRLHLQAADLPIVGDQLYGKPSRKPLGLRAVELGYRDPFTKRPVRIRATSAEFLREYGFAEPSS